MKDLIKKAIYTGMGLASMTRDKIEELSRKFAETFRLSEEEGRRLAQELISQSENAKKNLEMQVERMVKSALKKLDILTRDDLEKLERRIKDLEDAVQQMRNEVKGEGSDTEN